MMMKKQKWTTCWENWIKFYLLTCHIPVSLTITNVIIERPSFIFLHLVHSRCNTCTICCNDETFEEKFNFISVLLENKASMENMYRAAHGIGDVMVDIASPDPAYMTGKIIVVCYLPLLLNYSCTSKISCIFIKTVKFVHVTVHSSYITVNNVNYPEIRHTTQYFHYMTLTLQFDFSLS